MPDLEVSIEPPVEVAVTIDPPLEVTVSIAEVALAGSDGQDGSDGANGARGSRILTALSPADWLNNPGEGDLYYDGAGNVFVWDDGGYVFVGSITGPPGPGINVIEVEDADWPPPADANPLNWYVHAAP